jgi:hypothetical protein
MKCQSRIPYTYNQQPIPVRVAEKDGKEYFEYVERSVEGEFEGLRYKGIHEYRLSKLLFETTSSQYIWMRNSVNTEAFS